MIFTLRVRHLELNTVVVRPPDVALKYYDVAREVRRGEQTSSQHRYEDCNQLPDRPYPGLYRSHIPQIIRP